MNRRLLPAILILLAPFPCRAGSSWQVRTVPDGSGRWIEVTSSRSLRVFGAFEGGNVWETFNAGLSGHLVGGPAPFPIDSVSSIVQGGGYLIARGKLWSPGSVWGATSFPDSLGHVIAAALGSPRYDYCLGTAEGIVWREAAAASRWTRVAALGSPVRRMFDLAGDKLGVLLADGGFFAEDTTWIESPMRVSAVGFWNERLGHAIEVGTNDLWRTTDGGRTWTLESRDLEDPDLAPYAARARAIVIDSEGLGAIASGDAVLVTRDGGESWTVPAFGDGVFLDAAIDDQGQILTVGSRILRSEDGGRSFEQVAGGDFGRVTLGAPNTLWAVDHGLLLSVDQGKRWFRQPLPDRPERLRDVAASGDYEVWMRFDGPEGSRTFRSPDRGNTVIESDSAGALHGAIAWEFPAAGIGWAVTDTTVLRSDDGGRRWRSVMASEVPMTALAAADSFRAAVCGPGIFRWTIDGGSSWSDGPSPPEEGLRAIAFAGSDAWIGVGSGIYRASPGEPWSLVSAIAPDDTLLDVRVAPDGTGWACGTSGALIGTTDMGHTWEPYRVDLELNAVRGTFSRLSLIDGGDAVVGTGMHLVRYLPDRSGPIFRMGVSANPYLPRYVDIHVTARERLLGDTLRVSIDGVQVPAEMFDADGFLYRARYEIPAEPGDLLLTVDGRDWVGNERSDSRPLFFSLLDANGIGNAPWDEGTLDLRGEPGSAVTILGLREEVDPPPSEAGRARAPFEATSASLCTITAVGEGWGLLRWVDGAWTPSDQVTLAAGESAVLALAGDPAGTVPPERLTVYPVPNRGRCTIRWEGPGALPIRWELFDLQGRRLGEGVIARSAAGAYPWRAVDRTGRRLAAGIYWLRVREGSDAAVRRILIER